MFKKIRKVIPYLFITLMVFVFSTHQAHANMLVDFALGTLDSIVASLSQLVLYVMHYWVMVTAALFSVSINLNLHIKQFVDSTAGVYTVWKTIRDICSIFVIFMLLYTAIKLILSQEEKGLDSVGHLIKNIVIAGILINFSFFITSLLIDASNMVSLAIYKGIVSTDQTINQNTGSSPCITNSTATPATTCLVNSMLAPKTAASDASLADFFMSKLSPQSVYKLDLANSANAGAATTDTTPAPLRTLIQGVVGAVIMFTVGMSFLFASIAFASRLVILVILLAFSSIWFASWIFPALKDKSKEFADILKGQLIFMPVYLILLYAALVVLNNSTIFNSPTSTGTVGTGVGGWMSGYIVLAVNDFFIIFLLNLPLVTAFSFASTTTKWLGADKFNANAIWSKVGKSSGSFVGRNTAGRAAHIAVNSGAMKKLSAWSPSIGTAVSKQISKTENYGFGQKKGGFKDVAEQKQKDYEANYKRVSTVDKTRYDNTVRRNDAGQIDPNGKTALERAEAAAAVDAANYHKNATNTIMGKMMSSVGVSAQKQATLGMNVGGRKAQEVIGKQRKAEEDKQKAKDAAEALKKLADENDKLDEEYDATIENMTEAEGELVEDIRTEEKQLAELTRNHERDLATIVTTHEKQIADYLSNKEQEAEKFRAEIRSIRAGMSGQSTTAQETALASIESDIANKKANSASELAVKKAGVETTYTAQKTLLESELADYKTTKVDIEEQKRFMSDKRKERRREFEKTKRDSQAIIDAAKDITAREANDALINTIKTSGGSSTPPPAPKP